MEEHIRPKQRWRRSIEAKLANVYSKLLTKVVMLRKIRILFFTYSPWNDNRSMGETYSNIFGDMLDRFEIAHLFFSPSMPDNSICFTYYNIPYNQLLCSALSGKMVGGALSIDKNGIHRDVAIGRVSRFY